MILNKLMQYGNETGFVLTLLVALVLCYIINKFLLLLNLSYWCVFMELGRLFNVLNVFTVSNSQNRGLSEPPGYEPVLRLTIVIKQVIKIIL